MKFRFERVINIDINNKEDIKRQFELLKFHDATIKRVWDLYQYGDIESYTEALKLMIIQLVSEKQDLSKRLLWELNHNTVSNILR